MSANRVASCSIPGTAFSSPCVFTEIWLPMSSSVVPLAAAVVHVLPDGIGYRGLVRQRSGEIGLALEQVDEVQAARKLRGHQFAEGRQRLVPGLPDRGHEGPGQLGWRHPLVGTRGKLHRAHLALGADGDLHDLPGRRHAGGDLADLPAQLASLRPPPARPPPSRPGQDSMRADAAVAALSQAAVSSGASGCGSTATRSPGCSPCVPTSCRSCLATAPDPSSAAISAAAGSTFGATGWGATPPDPAAANGAGLTAPAFGPGPPATVPRAEPASASVSCSDHGCALPPSSPDASTAPGPATPPPLPHPSPASSASS